MMAVLRYLGERHGEASSACGYGIIVNALNYHASCGSSLAATVMQVAFGLAGILIPSKRA